MAHIILDVAYETTLEESMNEVQSRFDIDYEVVNENGPGGGWPEVKFTGDREDLAGMISEFYDTGDPESNQEIIDSIEE